MTTRASPYNNLPIATPAMASARRSPRSSPLMSRMPLTEPQTARGGGGTAPAPVPPRMASMRSFVQSSPARKLSVRDISSPLGPAAAPPFVCAACTKPTPAPPAGKCTTCAGTDTGPEAGWLCEGCFTVHSRGLMRNHVFNLPGAAGGAGRSERELLLEQIGAVSLPPLSCRTHGGQPNAGLAFYWCGRPLHLAGSLMQLTVPPALPPSLARAASTTGKPCASSACPTTARTRTWRSPRPRRR